MNMDRFYNDKLPSSMKNIVFREVAQLIEKLKMENNADYKVALLTTSGTIIGTLAPCSTEAEMIKYTDDPNMFTLDSSAIFDVLTKKYNSEMDRESVYSDAYMINILDATVYRHGLKEELMVVEQMILFADQIVGFYLIKKR